MLHSDRLRGLVPAAPQPLPPTTGPRPARWLPHVLVVLAAGVLGLTGADGRATLLAAAHAVTLVVALRWPVPAWWLSTVMVVVIPVTHPPTPSNQVWAWVVHAGVLLLVALRNPPRTAAATAVLSGVAAVALKLADVPIGSWETVATAAVLFALAALGGTPAEQPGRYAEVSPSAHVRPGLMPTLLVVGDRDRSVDTAIVDDFGATLARAGVEVEVRKLSFGVHAFDDAYGSIVAQTSRRILLDFLLTRP